MRYAILSDVHANATALRSVLADATDMQAERIVCLGDVLGYGPEPVAALELIHRSAHVCLAGNHDDAVAGRCSTEDFTDFASAAVTRHRGQLAQSALDWLRQLPHTCSYPDFACAHGDFSDPKNFNYVLTAEEAVPSWAATREQILFIGHTHEPALFVLGASGEPHAIAPEDFTCETGKRYLVNVGSVGYPRSGACRSSYCIFDDISKSVYFRSLPFDLEGYAAKMHGQGLDEAPWMQARAVARRRPDVRASESFAKPHPRKVGRLAERPQPPSPPCAPSAFIPPARAPRPSSADRRLAWLAVASVALAVSACMFLWFSRIPEVPQSALAAVETHFPVTDAEPSEGAAPDAAYVRGVCVRTERRTVPGKAARVWYAVRLEKHSPPAAVRIRFVGARGEPVGGETWVSGIKRSRRSAPSGIPAPEGAITAILDVIASEASNPCRIESCELSTSKPK